MNCKNCNNTLPGDAKFCNKCGKPIESNKTKVDIEKVKKSLKNTGNSVCTIGWITIIINVGIYLWSVLDKNFADSGLPVSDLSGTFLVVVAASIFIILGNRIKELVDKNIKLYLQILLGLSLLLLVWVIYTGGRVGILFFFVVAYLISSLISVRKAMKVEEFTSTLTSPKYSLDKKGWVIFTVISVVLFFVAVVIDLSSYDLGVDSYTTQEKSNLIIETVREIKMEMKLPNQIDDLTTLTDITAQSSAIRYHYFLSNIDTSQLSISALKNYLISDICTSDTKNLLDSGINIEYSYIVDSGERYFVSFTKTDCSAY